MKLADPATAITDYILCVEAVILGSLLWMNAGSQLSVAIWAAAFIAIAVSSMAGGIFHHGRLEFSETARKRLWILTAGSLLSALCLFIAGGLFAALAGKLKFVALAATILFFIVGMYQLNHSRAPGSGVNTVKILSMVLLALSLLFAYLWYAGAAASGRYIVAGSILCTLGTLVQQAEPRIHRHFNHNDVCHLIFMAGIYFLYCGGLLLKDK